MVKITLWEALSNRFGLLIPAKSGFVYTNQVGGTSCNHPELEGIYVPLPMVYGPRGCPMYDLNEYGNYNPDLVQEFLRHHGLNKFFTSEDVSSDVCGLLAEAWVPVRVRPTEEVTLGPLAGWSGILVYENSD